MLCFLFAGKNEDYTCSAYAFEVAHTAVHTGAHFGWTVQEAYLNGLRDMSDYIIERKLWQKFPLIEVCTPSKMVITLLTTDKLEVLRANGWKNPDGKPLFHVSILQELYWHRLYYKEREVLWDGVNEIDESEMAHVDICRDAVEDLLANPT